MVKIKNLDFAPPPPPLPILVTGCAGFIGMAVTLRLLDEGFYVIGVDNLNDYYDPQLKKNRLAHIVAHPHADRFQVHKVDVSDRQAMADLWQKQPPTQVIHLAAQAGVRHSLVDPFLYLQSNLLGFLVVLELCRYQKGFQHLIYASSSSVYGGNDWTEEGFAESQPTVHPLSFYAATKASNELMAQSYAHLYGFSATGLRFFTVYGPWGRPDMAYYKFADKITKGETLDVYNHGEMSRDFTYIDDIVDGIIGALEHKISSEKGGRHVIYNLGNNRPEKLTHLIQLIETSLGKKATIRRLPLQPGDGIATCANIDRAQRELGYTPKVSLDEGIGLFVEWYRGQKLDPHP